MFSAQESTRNNHKTEYAIDQSVFFWHARVQKGLYDLERAVKNPIVNPGRMSVSEDPEYWRHTVLVQKSVTISETVR